MSILLTADNFERFADNYGSCGADLANIRVPAAFVRFEIIKLSGGSTGVQSCGQEDPELLIRESGGQLRLCTNYYLRTGSGSGRMEGILAEGRFLGTTAREILRVTRIEDPSPLPAPDEDFVRYAGGTALNTSLRSGYIKREGGMIVPAVHGSDPADFSGDAENIMLRTLYLLYISAGAGACPGQTDDIRKKRTENALKKLSRPVFDLATKKAAADYSFAEVLSLSAAGSCLLNC